MNFRFISEDKVLSVASQLYIQGRLDQAIENVNTIINKTSYQNEIVRLKAILLKILILERGSKFNQAKDLYKQYQTVIEGQNDQIIKVYFKLVHTTLIVITEPQENINTIFEILDKDICDLPSPYNDDLNAEYLIIQGNYFLTNGKLNLAKKKFLEALKIKVKIKDQMEMAGVHLNLGVIEWQSGNLEVALEYLFEALSLSYLINNNLMIAKSLNNIGNVFHHKGELETALEYYQKSLTIKREINDSIQIAFTLNNIGTILSKQGLLGDALDKYEECLKILKFLKRTKESETVMNNIGTLYHKRGLLHKALQYYERCLQLRKKSGTKRQIALSMHNIGEVYRDLGNYDKSREFLTEAYNLRLGTNDKLSISDTLLELILLNLKVDEISYAKNLLTQLENIATEENNKIIDFQYNLAKALILKNSPRFREKTKSIDLLYQLIQQQTVNHYLSIFAMKELFDLLLLEYSTLRESEVLREIQTLLESLMLTANDQQSPSLLAEIYTLQAKFSLIKGNLASANDQIQEAKKIIIETGVTQHNKFVNEALNQLKLEFEKWSDLVNDNLTTYTKIVKSIGTLTADQIEMDSPIPINRELDRFDSLQVLPLQLAEFKSVLHPVKLTIMKLLTEYNQISRNEILKILKINSGTLEKYIKQLANSGYLEAKIELVGTRPRSILYLEPRGAMMYKEFKIAIQRAIEIS